MLLHYCWFQCISTIYDCPRDYFSVIICNFFSPCIQKNILKMSTCLVALRENYKRGFIVFWGQIVGARHGGSPETERHSQEKGKTQEQNKALGTPLPPHLWWLPSSPGSMFQTCIHSASVCLGSALCQARCQDTVVKRKYRVSSLVELSIQWQRQTIIE